eukprot:253055-Pelagomonas_calceolata.AAC.6
MPPLMRAAAVLALCFFKSFFQKTCHVFALHLAHHIVFIHSGFKSYLDAVCDDPCSCSFCVPAVHDVHICSGLPHATLGATPSSFDVLHAVLSKQGTRPFAISFGQKDWCNPEALALPMQAYTEMKIHTMLFRQGTLDSVVPVCTGLVPSSASA